MRAAAAKHVGVKVVPTEVAHQKRSHSAKPGCAGTSSAAGLDVGEGAAQRMLAVHQGVCLRGRVDR
jgi:hypothetical protein